MSKIEQTYLEDAYAECHGGGTQSKNIGFACQHFVGRDIVKISKEYADATCAYVTDAFDCYKTYFRISIRHICKKDADILEKFNIRKSDCPHVLAQAVAQAYRRELRMSHIQLEPDNIMTGG